MSGSKLAPQLSEKFLPYLSQPKGHFNFDSKKTKPHRTKSGRCIISSEAPRGAVLVELALVAPLQRAPFPPRRVTHRPARGWSEGCDCVPSQLSFLESNGKLIAKWNSTLATSLHLFDLPHRVSRSSACDAAEPPPQLSRSHAASAAPSRLSGGVPEAEASVGSNQTRHLRGRSPGGSNGRHVKPISQS